MHPQSKGSRAQRGLSAGAQAAGPGEDQCPLSSTCEPVSAARPALGSPVQDPHGHSGPWPVARLARWQGHMVYSERLMELSLHNVVKKRALKNPYYCQLSDERVQKRELASSG